MSATDQRWQRVNELFHAALAHPSGERDAFLAIECGADSDLHREVLSLIAAHTSHVSPLVTPGTRLGDYEVTAFLAAGGMGHVYRARDTKLGRDVALKVLPAAFVSDPDRRARFDREARLLASLNHPNIATIYGHLESGPISALALELVEGETLAERIARGKLPAEEALRIAKQIAVALEAAHERGIIHRDLKPANIKVRRDSTVKVLDFGLAKFGASAPREQSPARDVATVAAMATAEHAVIGTPAYMSPEQARGEQVDKRTDIWAFGCVLFEMLSGTPAFAATTVADTLARVVDGAPDWTLLPARTPPSVRRLLTRALVKDLGGRLNDIGDARLEVESADIAQQMLPRGEAEPAARRATRRFGVQAAALVAALGVLTAAGWYLMVGRARGAPLEAIRSIAVLPLQNLSGNPDDEYFADGATESLMASLAQLHAVDVISRTSTMRYKATTKPIRQIAQELGVDAIVEGAVQRVDGRVRISAQLIRAATDTHLWAKEYDRDARNILQLQSDIARAIVDEIRPKFATGPASPAKTVSPDAQEAYLLGRYHYWKNNEPEVRKAIEYFDRATQLEPDYAEAYAGSSLAWGNLGDFGDPRSLSEGRRAAARALAIDPKLAIGYAALGNVLLKNWEWVEADKAFKTALELDADQLDACGCYAIFLSWQGRIEEALATIEHARKVDPLSTTIEWQYGVILYFARRYDEAVAHIRRAIELDPRNVPAYRTLVRTYEEADRVQDALPFLDRPQFQDSYELGIAYLMQGRRDDALRILQHVEAKGDSNGAATLSLWLHDDDRAFRWLRRALDEKRPLVTNLKVAPVYDRVRSDPRFAELVHRLNLPD